MAAAPGNPFLLEELVKALADAGVDPTPATVQSVREMEPKSIIEAVVARLERLPAAACAFARAAAVLGTSAELRHAAALAGLNEASPTRCSWSANSGNHLGNAYRKLDIRFRDELHRILSHAPASGLESRSAATRRRLAIKTASSAQPAAATTWKQ